MADDGSMKKRSSSSVAAENWARYEYARDRGHSDYCNTARRCEDYYLGGGCQWTEEDKETLRIAKRPAYEFNEVMPGVNSALGYQIANRMDISYVPRGGMADQDVATVLSKVAMQVADTNKLHWKETQVYGDGLIQQRGYYDLRMDFGDQMRGEIVVDTSDPMDVLPDPDAKEYDPRSWSDVIVTRWLTLDEIEARYGKPARAITEEQPPSQDSDFGEREARGEERNKFGTLGLNGAPLDATWGDKALSRWRIIDRQKWEMAMTRVAIMPDTGDVRSIEDSTPEQLAGLKAKGALFTRRMQRRVRWIVSTWDTVLHDEYSPYPFFTIIPYFCYFRRGRTRGMVDNAMGPQDALNKTFSQYVHIINSVANSGWKVEQNSLTNMEVDDLESEGAKTGLVIEYAKGSKEPEKIEPNKVPEGVDRFIDRVTKILKEVTTPDEMRGIGGDDQSGIALQSKQFASQQQLAIPLDNLARSRHMLAEALLWLIQHYYDDERVFRITETDPQTGRKNAVPVAINAVQPDGTVLNDVTLGEYDVVIAEVPMQVTFENGQFEQALNMRKEGVAIPDDVIIKHSNLAEKTELLERMAQAQPQTDPLVQAKLELLKAQADKTRVESVNKAVEAQFGAIQTAQTIAQIPQTAPLADALLKSSGFEDKDAPPIVPELAGPVPGVPPPASNTDPLTPQNPAVGVNAGIKTPDVPA